MNDIKNIAVIIPCFNEEATIGKVITDFKRKLPEAAIYVFDNNSQDRTAETAKYNGAIVIKEKRQGKGFVVQSMFAKVDADVYVMIDGDGTYDIKDVDKMIEAIVNDDADMVVGTRLRNYADNSFRAFHTFGNRLVALFINKLFSAKLTDIMSGFRVMNKDFVKNINSNSRSFEVETEITIKALKYGYLIREMNINYGERPVGSFSKLRTFKDGVLILKTIAIIFRDYRPLLFFSAVSLVLFLISISSGLVVIEEFIETRYITHVPLAIFSTGSMILSMMSLVAGIILESVNKRFDDIYNFMRDKT